MEAGLLIRWGKLVPGREREAVALFDEFHRYLARNREQGTISYFEPFFLSTSDVDEEMGFWVIKAPVVEVFRLVEDEHFLELKTRASYVVEHLRMDVLTVGEGITRQRERAEKVRAELGI